MNSDVVISRELEVCRLAVQITSTVSTNSTTIIGFSTIKRCNPVTFLDSQFFNLKGFFLALHINLVKHQIMKQILLLFVAFLITSNIAVAQGDFYTTSGGEIILSFATIDNNGNANGNIVRFSPVFNGQFYGNYDLNKNFGLLFGAAIRNVGFIYDTPSDSYFEGKKMKFRNYNFGIPVGIKVGNMNKAYFFAGYEIEFPFVYKEKAFENEMKTKFSVWFSKRVPAYYHTVFAGVQFPYGISLKFKYYLSEFFNQDYIKTDGSQPYKGLKANVFYFSISTSLFKGTQVYVKEYKEEMRVY